LYTDRIKDNHRPVRAFIISNCNDDSNVNNNNNIVVVVEEEEEEEEEAISCHQNGIVI